jgi:type III restriction enzyme
MVQSATEHTASNGGKPWNYLLIPDDQILANTSLAGLAAKFAMRSLKDAS